MRHPNELLLVACPGGGVGDHGPTALAWALWGTAPTPAHREAIRQQVDRQLAPFGPLGGMGLPRNTDPRGIAR